MTREPPVCDCPSYTALEAKFVRLRAEVERLTALLQSSENIKCGYFDEVERLRAELEDANLRYDNLLRAVNDKGFIVRAKDPEP